METITAKQAYDAVEGFIINHSHYNFWDTKTEEYQMLLQAKKIKHDIGKLIQTQERIKNASY